MFATPTKQKPELSILSILHVARDLVSFLRRQSIYIYIYIVSLKLIRTYRKRFKIRFLSLFFTAETGSSSETYLCFRLTNGQTKTCPPPYKTQPFHNSTLHRYTLFTKVIITLFNKNRNELPKNAPKPNASRWLDCPRMA